MQMMELLESLYGLLNSKFASQKEPDFVYGYRPSSLDAALFAHIALVREVPSTLQHILDAYPELQHFYERIYEAYFIHNRTGEEVKECENAFVKGMHVQQSNPRMCYVTRKLPCERRRDALWVDEEKEEKGEETEEEVYGGR